jgi:hypothetical protein
MPDIEQNIDRIFGGYLQNLAQFDGTVELLESYYHNLSPTERTGFFDVLWRRFSSAPISHLTGKRSPHEIVIRAWARFGPADALPAHLFGALNWSDPAQMESWAVKIGSEFIHSLFSYKVRFSKAALDQVKAQVTLITSDKSSELVGVAFPPQLQEVASRLSTAVDKINFESFQHTIVGPRSRPIPKEGRAIAVALQRDLKPASMAGGRSSAVCQRAVKPMSF